MRKLPMKRVTYGKKAMELPPLCAFDFETEGLGGKFIVGAFVTSDGERMLFRDIRSCWDYIVQHPDYRYLAHNASGYEFAYLYPTIYEFLQLGTSARTDIQDENIYGMVPTLQGDTRIVQIRITRNNKAWIDLRDTLCLFNMPLRAVAKAFCPELPKLVENINFEKDTFNPDNPQHIDYVFRDCDIVLLAYQRHASNMDTVFHSPLGVTAGSSALKAFYTTIDPGKCYWRLNSKVDEFVREGYYGGLVLPGKQIGEWGAITGVDVNGAYAYQMLAHNYPVGTPAHTHVYLGKDVPAFYRIEAIVPPSIYNTLGFNPLPKREKAGLTWPTGTFETVVSMVEIDFALRYGCEITVLGGYAWLKSEPIFKNFVEKCQEMELVDGGIYKPTIKQNRNSLYGKFGARSGHTSLCYCVGIPDPTLGFRPLINEETGQHVAGMYTGTETSDAEYMLPHLAALITAYERVYLMEFIAEAYRRGAKNVYCDTDSIKCDHDVIMSMVGDGYIPVGNKYGQFKVEDHCTSYILLGPKCFTGRLSTGGDVIKAKGIRTSALSRRHYIVAMGDRRKAVSFDAVESLMNIIKTQTTVHPVKRSRKITDLRNSFAWQLDQEGRIYPHGYQMAQT